MALEHRLEIRPANRRQILDDAWRISLANAPQLLLLSGLFAVPAAVALIFCSPPGRRRKTTWHRPGSGAHRARSSR